MLSQALAPVGVVNRTDLGFGALLAIGKLCREFLRHLWRCDLCSANASQGSAAAAAFARAALDASNSAGAALSLTHEAEFSANGNACVRYCAVAITPLHMDRSSDGPRTSTKEESRSKMGM